MRTYEKSDAFICSGQLTPLKCHSHNERLLRRTPGGMSNILIEFTAKNASISKNKKNKSEYKIVTEKQIQKQKICIPRD